MPRDYSKKCHANVHDDPSHATLDDEMYTSLASMKGQRINCQNAQG